MILAKAMTPNGEEVKGYFNRLADGRLLICHVELTDKNSDDYLFGAVKYTSWHIVDTDTLKYSLDNGESWYSDEELKDAVKVYEYMKIPFKERSED